MEQLDQKVDFPLISVQTICGVCFNELSLYRKKLPNGISVSESWMRRFSTLNMKFCIVGNVRKQGGTATNSFVFKLNSYKSCKVQKQLKYLRLVMCKNVSCGDLLESFPGNQS